MVPWASRYFGLISHCRHLGCEVSPKGRAYWAGRVGRKGGRHFRRRIGFARVPIAGTDTVLSVDFNPLTVCRWRGQGLEAEFGDATAPKLIAKFRSEVRTGWCRPFRSARKA